MLPLAWKSEIWSLELGVSISSIPRYMLQPCYVGSNRNKLWKYHFMNIYHIKTCKNVINEELSNLVLWLFNISFGVKYSMYIGLVPIFPVVCMLLFAEHFFFIFLDLRAQWCSWLVTLIISIIVILSAVQVFGFRWTPPSYVSYKFHHSFGSKIRSNTVDVVIEWCIPFISPVGIEFLFKQCKPIKGHINIEVDITIVYLKYWAKINCIIYIEMRNKRQQRLTQIPWILSTELDSITVT